MIATSDVVIGDRGKPAHSNRPIQTGRMGRSFYFQQPNMLKIGSQGSLTT